jgi:membrane protein implicated in regulation of membrane protease activity
MSMPMFLLISGIFLMVLGSVLVTASVAVTGIAFALAALALAYFRATAQGQGRPTTA